MHKLILYSSFIGRESIILPTCQSTNQLALQMCEKESPEEGQVILTYHQTAGKGQRGNTWQSESHKNLTISIILKPTFLDLQKQFYLNIISSLAVADFLSPFLPEAGLAIKWPNDILYQEKKICGILIENIIRGSRLEYSVIGVGVNLNQDTFSYPRAASLKNFTNKEYEIDEMAARFLKALEERYLMAKAGQTEALKAAYLKKLFRYGEEADYLLPDKQAFRGKIMGVQEDGRLVILVGDDVKSFDFKALEFVYGTP